MAHDQGTPIVAEGFPVLFRDQTVWHNPENFPQSLVISVDYDKTLFDTSADSGKGPSVPEAYEIALEQVCGKQAREDYVTAGGLDNRAPQDIVSALMHDNPQMLSLALDHANEHFAEPEDISDYRLGMIAQFVDRGKLTEDDLACKAITEMLVIRKKELVIPQIGPDWPIPTEGYVDFWNRLNEQKQHGDWGKVHTAIVSSGHTDFIAATFDVHDLTLPDVFMTDDEMRLQAHPTTKPDPYGLQVVEAAWMRAYSIPIDQRTNTDFVSQSRERQVYIGDDRSKDGEMAANHGIRFMHYDGSVEAWGVVYNALDRAAEGGSFS